MALYADIWWRAIDGGFYLLDWLLLSVNWICCFNPFLLVTGSDLVPCRRALAFRAGCSAAWTASRSVCFYFWIRFKVKSITSSRPLINSLIVGLTMKSGITPCPSFLSFPLITNCLVGIWTDIRVLGNVIISPQPQITFLFPPVSSPIIFPLL